MRVHDAENVGEDHLPPLFRVAAGGAGAFGAAPGIGKHHVDRAECVEHLGRHLLLGGEILHVAGDGHGVLRAEFGNEAVELLLRACRERDAVAGLDCAAGGRRADAARAAGDEHGFYELSPEISQWAGMRGAMVA